ncbi:MAG TPA: type II toxin-antitoxin system VapC family toxin [Coxiellaceae bacterium]|nr:type II toxin-antitoxin system VapC family toxin [Coxiellaceae bacterium]
MIILDTNIVSELMKPVPNSEVIAWLDEQEVMELFITTITIAEISYGINVLPEGKRRSFLDEAFKRAVVEAFKHRTLSFDESAAHAYGGIMAPRKGLGKPLSVCDGQIAAIAFSHKAAIATHNLADFADCSLELINPFELPA